MRKPDFVIPGFTRCGTTWLYEVLRHHPEIALPVRKELNFFNRAYDKGLEWYYGYFEDCPPGKITGDISPVYAEDPAVPERIAAAVPEARIVLILRSHIERLRSIYWHLVRDGRRNDDLVRYLDGQTDQTDFIAQQRYAPVVEAYRALFPDERLMVMVYEDLRDEPYRMIGRICEFLGVSGSDFPDEMAAVIGKHVNPTFQPKHPGMYRRAQQVHQTLRRTQLKALDRPLDAGKRAFFKIFGERERKALGTIPGENRLQGYFESDTAEIERILGRSLRDRWQHV